MYYNNSDILTFSLWFYYFSATKTNIVLILSDPQGKKNDFHSSLYKHCFLNWIKKASLKMTAVIEFRLSIAR